MKSYSIKMLSLGFFLYFLTRNVTELEEKKQIPHLASLQYNFVDCSSTLEYELKLLRTCMKLIFLCLSHYILLNEIDLHPDFYIVS